MASGVKVVDGCCESFDRLKSKKCAKICLFKLNDKNTEVVVDKELVCKPTDNKYDCFEAFVKNLPENECRYGAFEYAGRVDEEGKVVEKVVFVSWAPTCAKMKQKMVHASTLSAVKTKLKVNEILQINDKDDLDEDQICAKFRIKLNKTYCEEQKALHPYHPEEDVAYHAEGDHCQEQQQQHLH